MTRTYQHQRERGLTAGIRRKLAAVRDRFSAMMLLIIAHSLGVAVLALAIIGAPPRWRIDALWVSKHVHLVRVMVIATLVALGASVLLMLWRKPRGWLIILWLTAVTISVAFFWDQLVVIIAMLRRHGF